ncbi:RNA-binding ATPase activator esf2 [Fusarium oxysporum]|nr:RNA-binding ATPase activator esf2 [Fusarium oxysporum]
MAPETKNDFLDTADSDEENDVGYNSEDDDMKKGGRGAKRRKLDSDDEDDMGSDIEHDASDDEGEPAEKDSEKQEKGEKEDDKPEKPKRKSKDTTSTELPDVTRTLTKKNLVASEAAIKKSGVVYLSRIPPFMKPAKLRSLLEPYGTINRIFLAPEDPASHARRVRAGGNKKRSYTEGWVEFTKRRTPRLYAIFSTRAPLAVRRAATTTTIYGIFYTSRVSNGTTSQSKSLPRTLSALAA